MTIVGNKIIGFYNNQNELCDIDNATYVKLELPGRAKELEQNYFLISKSCLEKVIPYLFKLKVSLKFK